MGAGTIIASAIVIVLLIITGYVLIGGTLSTAQIVMAAQRAAAEKEGQRIHTRIEIINASTNETSSQTFVEVKNTGSEVVGDFHHMESVPPPGRNSLHVHEPVCGGELDLLHKPGPGSPQPPRSRRSREYHSLL